MMDNVLTDSALEAKKMTEDGLMNSVLEAEKMTGNGFGL